MGSIKYFIVGLLAVGLFVGGAFFMRLSEQKNSFLGNKPASNFSQTLTLQKELPIERYVGAFGFKTTAQNPQPNAQELIKNTLSSAIERARKEGFCSGGDFDLQKNKGTTGEDIKEADFSGAIGGIIECSFSAEKAKDYQVMLKDIDYLALKSGVIKLANYGIEPLITQEQLSSASKEIYAELFGEVKKQQSAIEGGFGTKCEVERVELFDEYRQQNAAGHHSIVLKKMGANASINGSANAGVERESSLADFALPLQTSKNVGFRTYISFQCK